MNKKLEAIVRMLEKIDSPDKIWLGELLLQRMQNKLTEMEMAEAQATLFLQKVYTEILFI
jgi:hypothetical protein